jgi:hypothetical protein
VKRFTPILSIVVVAIGIPVAALSGRIPVAHSAHAQLALSPATPRSAVARLRELRREVARDCLHRRRSYRPGVGVHRAVGLLSSNDAATLDHVSAEITSHAEGPRTTRARLYRGCLAKPARLRTRNAIKHMAPLVLIHGWPDARTLAYTPNRIAATPAGFAAIMATLRPGDVVEVKPMTITGEVSFDQRLSAPASVYFDEGVRFTGALEGSNRPAIWLHASNLRLYGGDVSNVAQDCVRVQAGSADTSGPANIRWWGLRIHDCAGTGFSVQGTYYPNTGLDIQADIWACGQNINLDPHAEKGTGLHGAYLGGGSTISSGRFVFYVHDQPTGAAVSIGANLQSSQLWVEASRITFQATSEVAGNAIQFWGDNNQNVTVMDVEANDLAGRVVETDGLLGGSGLVIDHARATQIRLAPEYALGSYVTCIDCG